MISSTNVFKLIVCRDSKFLIGSEEA